ncbi:MAG: PilZ domain-containing protein, partial [Calditrichia bacterium]|nr:PilZ domain-containing protein [Calditrichia bacterium]
LVYIRYLKKINWLNRFTGPCILDDIAISSVRFVCPKNFLANSQVEIKLESYSLNSEFVVKGRIIGKKADLFENKYEYVVQFNPYGKGLKYNSFQSKEKLERFFKSLESDQDI